VGTHKVVAVPTMKNSGPGARALNLDNVVSALVSILLLTIKITSTFEARLILNEQIDKAYENYEEVDYLQYHRISRSFK